MPISIDGSAGTITGIASGGLPDAIITTAEIIDANVTPAKLSQKLTLGTAVASTSGTAIDFTGIPSWVKRVTVMFNNVSTSGASNIIIQVGSGSFQTSGYTGLATRYNGSVGASYSAVSNGFVTGHVSATDATIGHISITPFGASNLIICSHTLASNVNTITMTGTGGVVLSGTLDRVRITTANGTDTFDGGSINIMYEG